MIWIPSVTWWSSKNAHPGVSSTYFGESCSALLGRWWVGEVRYTSVFKPFWNQGKKKSLIYSANCLFFIKSITSFELMTLDRYPGLACLLFLAFKSLRLILLLLPLMPQHCPLWMFHTSLIFWSEFSVLVLIRTRHQQCIPTLIRKSNLALISWDVLPD